MAAPPIAELERWPSSTGVGASCHAWRAEDSRRVAPGPAIDLSRRPALSGAMRTPLATTLGLVLSLNACGTQPPPEPMAPPTPVESSPAPVDTQTLPGAGAAMPEAGETKAPAPPTAIVRFAQGIATPESAFYDAERDRYLVSNINGKPFEPDNNGFIAELSPEGTVIQEKFIAGGVKQVKLDAPKGLGIWKGVLYVADITRVRKFDAKTGAPKGEIPIPGATFLNDIAVGADGRVYVSDSGVTGENFAATGTDAVYVIEKDKPKALAKSPELGGPNGLLALEQGVLVNTFRSNEVYRLDEKGMRHDLTKLPTGGLDGMVGTADALLVTSWEGSAIYLGKLGGPFDVAFANLSGSADIGIDTKRKRLIVPRFLDSAVEVYALP